MTDMPGAHSFVQYILTYKFYTNHGPGSWTLQEKKKSKPAHGPPLQARVVAANGTVRTTHNDDPGAHGMNRGKAKLNGTGQPMRWAVGMAWQRRAGTQSPQNKAAAGEHSRRTIQPAQASKNNSQQLAGLAAKQQPADVIGRPLAVQWRECGGAGSQEVGSDLPYLSPSHLSPLPVTIPTHSLNL